MGRIRGHYEWDDEGLTPGQKKEGGLHQNLFDSEGNLKGSARFVPDDGPDPEPLVVTETVYVPVEQRRGTREQRELFEDIAAMVVDVTARGLEKLWREKVHPAIDARRAQLRERRARRKAEQLPTIVGARASVRELAAEEIRPKMSRAEAQARYLAALAARAYSDEQMRLVEGSDIVDGEDLEQLQRSIAELPADKVMALLEAMATNPSLLGEDSLAELASILGQHGPTVRQLGREDQ